MAKLTINSVITERIRTGKDLLLSLQDFAKSNSIKSASIQIIGALERTNVGIYIDGKYEYIEHEGPVEIVSGLGNITLKEGVPMIHCHLMLSDINKRTFGGHLFEGCIVHPTAEVVITKYNETISRCYDKDLNLWLMDI